MARKLKLNVQLFNDTEIERAYRPTHVTLEFQGHQYNLTIGDTFNVKPKLTLTGDFEETIAEGIIFPIKVVGIH